MDSIVPYAAAAIVCFLASVLLLFIYLSRRVGDWIALAAVLPILFMGTAYEDLLTAFQINYFGSVALGIGALLAIERRDRRGDVIACVLWSPRWRSPRSRWRSPRACSSRSSFSGARCVAAGSSSSRPFSTRSGTRSTKPVSRAISQCTTSPSARHTWPMGSPAASAPCSGRASRLTSAGREGCRGGGRSWSRRSWGRRSLFRPRTTSRVAVLIRWASGSSSGC